MVYRGLSSRPCRHAGHDPASMQRTPPSARQSRARPGHGASPRRPVLSHRLPHSCSFSWPVAQLAPRPEGAIRSDRCDESVYAARWRARPRERTNAGPLSDRCAMARAGAALQETGWHSPDRTRAASLRVLSANEKGEFRQHRVATQCRRGFGQRFRPMLDDCPRC